MRGDQGLVADVEGDANVCGSHEHHARSPDCAFFELCNRPESPIAKKAATKRKPRTSTAKSTRLSMQSTLDPEPSYLEAPSFADDTIQDEGDSIATTTSIMPKGKGKKATAAKGRKKKAEPVVEDDHKLMDAPSEIEEAPAPPPKVTKGRKGKKVKEEPAPEPVEHNKSVMSAANGTLVVEEEESAPKSRRGKKRLSDSEADESIIAPAPKRRTRNSVAMQESILPDANNEISSSTPLPSKKATVTKRKPARASRSRKVSEASIAPESDNEPLDQLENELDRQLEDMDVQNPSRTHSPEMLNPKPAMAPLGRKLRNSGGRLENNHHDLFNQMEVDEDEVDREMQQMEEEEQISKPLSKGKGKKGVERKLSVKQQVKEEKARRKAAEEQTRREQAEREAEELRLRQEAEEAEELRLQEEAEAAEQLRLQKEAEEAERLRIKEENAEKRRRSAKLKADTAERVHQAQLRAEQQRLEEKRNQAEEEAEAHRLELEAEAEEEEGLRLEQEEEDERIRVEQEEEERQRLEEEAAAIQERILEKNEAEAAAAKAAKEEAAAAAKAAKAAEVAAAKASKAKGKGKVKAKPKSPSPRPEASPARSPTPAESSVHSPSVLEQSTPVQPASARSANRSAISHRSQRSVRTLSPSASPQSSDAENRPPSSRPSSSIQASSAMTARHSLGATTPKTPSRSLNRQPGNAKAGLHSETPWEEVDLDTIFAHMKSPDKENASLALGGAKGSLKVAGELTKEERKMTVEEWIRHNAVKAEERLKAECEALVGVFEREGMRAVASLEGVEVIEG